MANFETKDEKTKELIGRAAAEFFKQESNRESLITVTRTDIFDKGKKATVFITVFPTEKEAEALAFTKRKRSDFRKRLKSETGLVNIPFIDVLIDEGEKNRQKINDLSMNI